MSPSPSAAGIRPGAIFATAIAVLLSVVLPSGISAQVGPQTSAGIEAQLEEVSVLAPVTLDGLVLFEVRGVTSLPAHTRAAAIATRISGLARDVAFDPQTLRIEDSPVATQVLAGRQVVMNVFDADAAAEKVGRAALASLHMARITAAIHDYRADRSAPAVRRAATRALVAMGVLGVALFLIRRTWRWIDAFIERTYRHRLESLAARSREVLNAAHLWRPLRGTVWLAQWAALVGLSFVCVDYVLALFPQTRPVAWSLAGHVLRPFGMLWTSFAAQIPNLLFLIVLTFAVRAVLHLARRFFDAVERGRIALTNFERAWATPTYRLVRSAVIIFAVIVGYPYVPGSSSDAFKGVTLFLGVVFSLGSSSFIANMIAGHTMTYRRVFKVGDRVQVGDVSGVVTAIRLQVTHIRTPKNEAVVVPNSAILNTHVTNYSTLAMTDGLILHTTVGIGYETPWRQVEAMLISAARRTPDVLSTPPPFVRQRELGDFCVVYELNAYSNEPAQMELTYANLHRHILDVFNEYGVQIMTPAYVADPAVPKIVPRGQWHTAPAPPPEPGPEPR